MNKNGRSPFYLQHEEIVKLLVVHAMENGSKFEELNKVNPIPQLQQNSSASKLKNDEQVMKMNWSLNMNTQED